LSPPNSVDTGLFQPLYQAGARIFSNSWGTSIGIDRSAHMSCETATLQSFNFILVEFQVRRKTIATTT
jgi:C1A family cysteine protease